jgi:hypothetical protein
MTMSITLRRNLPLVLLFLALLTFLIVALGDQPIIAYTAERDELQAEPTATVATMDNRVTSAVGGATGTLGTSSADIASP